MEGLINSWPLFAMIPIFYFFMIRPQQKKQKEHEAVITLQLDTKTFVKVTRNSISKEMTEALKTSYDLG